MILNFNLFQMEAPVFKQEEYRSETDTFGEISVPRDKYFGANTARAIINFSIGDESERMPVSWWQVNVQASQFTSFLSLFF